MGIDKGKKTDWLGIVLVIAAILWGLAGLLGIVMAGTVVLFFDSPSPDWNANNFFLLSMVSFPLVCIFSSIAMLVLRNRIRFLAFCFCVLPVVPILLIIVGSNWMSMATCGKLDCTNPTMQEQANANSSSPCASPPLNSSAGPATAECGTLSLGVIVTGTTTRATSGHNWQFSARKGGRITITVESGASCPQVSVLDAAGKVVNAFAQDNKTQLCPSGMTTTSFFYFDPPSDGNFIVHVITPAVPGTYWLKIQ